MVIYLFSNEHIHCEREKITIMTTKPVNLVNRKMLERHDGDFWTTKTGARSA